MSSNTSGASTLQIVSLLTCAQCGFAEEMAMPLDACVFFHECRSCGVLLRPKAGDCCVFCSYGSVVCPPMQGGGGACCSVVDAANRDADPHS